MPALNTRPPAATLLVLLCIWGGCGQPLGPPSDGGPVDAGPQGGDAGAADGGDAGKPDGGADGGDAGGLDGGDAGQVDGGDAGGLDGGESVVVEPTCIRDPALLDGGYRLVLDFPYGPLDGGPNLMDVALPITAGVHPMIVFIHGGGFVAGDKTLFRSDLIYLAQRGYVAASLNYRLTLTDGGGNYFPDGLQDCRCAVRALSKLAPSIGADALRFAAIGSSAGGNLVDMLGLIPDASDSGYDGPCAWDGGATLSAVVSMYGAHNLYDSSLLGPVVGTFPTADLLSLYVGGPAASVPARLFEASPVTHVHPGAPPFLLLQGSQDTLVLPSNTTQFFTALRGAGVPATMVVVPAPHGFQLLSTDPALAPSVCTSLAFLKRYLQP